MMGTFSKLTLALLMTALPTAFAGCSDDSDDEASSGGEAGSEQATGDDQADDDQSDDDQSDDDQSDDDSSNGGSAGGGQTGDDGQDDDTLPECDLTREGRENVALEGDIEEDLELDASNYYTLKGIVHVLGGATLTIPPCTRIEGDGSSLGTLVISRGGRIVAEGRADRPILFTSPNTASGAVEPEPGDWGGLVILGRAENAAGPDVLIEGLADDPLNQHGSDDPDPEDDSGVLKYVKIEYSGIDLGDGNEINGLSLGSIGSGTTLSHVMVANTLDDCFEFFGGTVDADHLVCENGGDDMFDVDDGYQGTLSYLFGRHGAPISGDPNGFEWDGTTDYNGSIDSIPEVSNVTMCGSAAAQRGMVLRRGIRGSIDSAVVLGFPIGVDPRDEFANGSDTEGDVTITNSIVVADVLADDETDDPAAESNPNDDQGFDDARWFEEGSGNSTEAPFATDECNVGSSDGPSADVTGSDAGAFKGDAGWLNNKWTGWD